MDKPRTQQERRDTTSNAVLESACELFGSKGYLATSLEEIAESCGTTIRPIYHYFGNKKNLFLATAERMEQRLYEALTALESEQPNGMLISDYWDTFMRFGRDPVFRQIVLVDAPTILGRERWADSPVVKRALDLLCALFPQLSPETRSLIAQMAVAALTEAALSLAEPGNEAKERAFDEVSAFIRLGLGNIALPGKTPLN